VYKSLLSKDVPPGIPIVNPAVNAVELLTYKVSVEGLPSIFTITSDEVPVKETESAAVPVVLEFAVAQSKDVEPVLAAICFCIHAFELSDIDTPDFIEAIITGKYVCCVSCLNPTIL
jgi:hypothetical protein